jgi:hypothetical protein
VQPGCRTAFQNAASSFHVLQISRTANCDQVTKFCNEFIMGPSVLNLEIKVRVQNVVKCVRGRYKESNETIGTRYRLSPPTISLVNSRAATIEGENQAVNHPLIDLLEGLVEGNTKLF